MDEVQCNINGYINTKQHAVGIQKIDVINQIEQHGIWSAVNTRRIIGTILFYNAVN
jgi:hypothetical protein